MSEEHKKEECCGSDSKKSCGCCGGMKKIILGAIVFLFIFFCGYVVGKGYCPFSSCSGKICPIPQR